MSGTHEVADADIAIVGMAGRFPGAVDVDELWRRIAAGDDCLTDLDPDELIAEGVPAELVHSPEYVTRAGVLDDVEGFDPGFFGIGARDAAIMDPQHRHFLECAWAALESSAIVPERFDGAIGVFGGCGASTYLINNLLTNESLVRQLGWFLLRHTGNDKDFLATNVAYRLGLHGPAVNVQTACSTSLVAVHLAGQSLLAFECDLALAGGATIEAPHRQGYHYQEGEILARDGRCRAFDAGSSGTVLASGVGVVAMRRLRDAREAGDPILAVLKGTAVNNDGARKVSFLAPSVDGHADVVREALTVAGLSARDLQLFEAHGTGTAVGDPIEFTAVSDAFRTWTDDTGFCRLTSTKPNIGHLDTAAGVASLIKVVQAVRHRTLPPMANHTRPNPLIDLARSPFTLSSESTPWPGDVPRRAGVSSLGVGGTNAHVIVEEAPDLPAPRPSAPEQVLALSARSPRALADAAARLADHLAAHPEVELADVARTLVTGRRQMEHRRVVTATDVAHAAQLLRSPERHRSQEAVVDEEAPGLGLMFPGGGSHYPGMGAGLDDRFEVFHTVRRDGAALVRTLGGPDLLPLFAAQGDAECLRRPTASLPAVFLTSVALARQWTELGARPTALIGHSLGEYVVAHLAGVLSIEDAIALVVSRSRLMERVSGKRAAMLAVPLGEDQVRELLPPALSLAAINADDECVVAGDADEIAAFAARTAELGAEGTLIPLSAAAHSSLLDPILPDFLDAVRAVSLEPPRLRYPSNLTGTWITTEQATDPQYWVDHLRHTVRFRDCLRTVLDTGPMVLTEIGPGQALSSYARRLRPGPVAVVPSLRHPDHDVPDTAFTLQAYARQWAAGADASLEQLTGADRRRLRLPTYPFQHERCWVEPGSAPLTLGGGRTVAESPIDGSSDPPLVRIDDVDAACWIPSWEPAPPARPTAATGTWLVLGDELDSLVADVAAELERRGARVRTVLRRDAGARDEVDEHIAAEAGGLVVVAPAARGTDTFERSALRWLEDAGAVVRGAATRAVPARFVALTRGATGAGGSATSAADALALGIVLVAPREYPGLRARLVDLGPERTDISTGISTDISAVVDEVLDEQTTIVAHRAGERLVPRLRHTAVPRPPADAVTFREGGTYLMTGGLGGVGHVLAAHLVSVHRANLVLVASDHVPEPAERERWLARHAFDDPGSRRIRRLAALEALGTKVTVVTADVSDPASVRAALDDVEARVGPIDGAVHAAGVVRDRLLELATSADHHDVVAAKAKGAIILAEELQRRGADLLVLVSSTSTVLAPSGQTSYVAANAVLDALAGMRDGLRVATLNSGLWSGVGIASEAARRARLAIDTGVPVDHPMLTECSTGRDGSVHVVGRIDASHHWVLDEHRTKSGHAVLPGTGHLELMLAAATFAGREGAQLSEVSLLEPLTVDDAVPCSIRVTITAGDDPLVRVESDGGRGHAWRVHSEALLVPADPPTEVLDVDEMVGTTLDPTEPIAALRRHMDIGPRWDAVVGVRVGGDRAVARLELPEACAGEAPHWRAHPALVDAATAVAGLLHLGHDSQMLHVPVSYQAVRSSGDVPAAVTVVAVRDPASTPDLLRVDLQLFDDDREVLRIDGLALLAVSEPARLGVDVEAPAAAGGHRSTSLVELADELGLRPDEGAGLLERLVGGPYDRIIGSTIDLDGLLRRLDQVDDTAEAAHLDEGPTPTSIEAILRTIWKELLGVDHIDDDDDFFELGGHSLIAIRLMSRIQRDLGVRLQLATIFDAPTIAALASRLRSDRPDLEAALGDPGAVDVMQMPLAGTSPATMTRHLVPISSSGGGRPLFVVHGAGGNVLFLWTLARAMSGQRPIYGFQAHGIDGTDMPDPTIEAMAGRYVSELREHASGPYLLGGFSGGGLVAMEMVRQLQELGEAVDYVVLFDSPDGGPTPGRWARKRHVVVHALREGLGAVKPYLTNIVSSWTRRFVARPGERAAERERQQRALGYVDPGAHGFVNLFFYFSAAAARYRTGKYDVDVLLVKADTIWPTQPHDYGWGRHVTGTIDVRSVPGDHHSMFFPENAPRLAEVLGAALDQRDAMNRVDSATTQG